MPFLIDADSPSKTESERIALKETMAAGSALHNASTGEESKITAPPVAKEVDMDKLAYCVAVAETGNCTTGMGVTKNNCFGIMHWPNGVRTGKQYLTRDDSYEDFKRIWTKSYAKFSETGFPTYAMAKTWTGNDDTQTWLNNVTSCYYESL